MLFLCFSQFPSILSIIICKELASSCWPVCLPLHFFPKSPLFPPLAIFVTPNKNKPPFLVASQVMASTDSDIIVPMFSSLHLNPPLIPFCPWLVTTYLLKRKARLRMHVFFLFFWTLLSVLLLTVFFFFFFFQITLFHVKIYLFLSVLGLCCCMQSSTSCSKLGLFFIVVCELLIVVPSVVVMHGLSCTTACGIFQDQGSNLCSFSTTGPPWKSENAYVLFGITAK